MAKLSLQSQIDDLKAAKAKIEKTLNETFATKNRIEVRLNKSKREYLSFKKNFTNDDSLLTNFNFLYECDIIKNECELLKSTELSEFNKQLVKIVTARTDNFHDALETAASYFVDHPDLISLRKDIAIDYAKLAKTFYQIEVLNKDFVTKDYELSKCRKIWAAQHEDHEELESVFPDTSNIGEVALEASRKRKQSEEPSVSTKKSKSQIWFGQNEHAFQEALALYGSESSQIRLKLMAKHILEKTDNEFTTGQIGDHIRKSKSRVTVAVDGVKKSEEGEKEDNGAKNGNTITPDVEPPLSSAASTLTESQKTETSEPNGKTETSTRFKWTSDLENAFLAAYGLFHDKESRNELMTKYVNEKSDIKVSNSQVREKIRTFKRGGKLPQFDEDGIMIESSVPDAIVAAEPTPPSPISDNSPKKPAIKVWFGEVEDAFIAAFKKYGQEAYRNDMIAKYIKDRTGEDRTVRQISDHISKSKKKGSIFESTSESFKSREVVSDSDEKSTDKSDKVGENTDSSSEESSSELESADEELWNSELESRLKEALSKFDDSDPNQISSIINYITAKTSKVLTANEIKAKLATNFTLNETDKRYLKILNTDKYPPSTLWDFEKDKIILEICESFPKKGDGKRTRNAIISEEILSRTGDERNLSRVNKRIATLKKRNEVDLNEILSKD